MGMRRCGFLYGSRSVKRAPIQLYPVATIMELIENLSSPFDGNILFDPIDQGLTVLDLAEHVFGPLRVQNKQ